MSTAPTPSSSDDAPAVLVEARPGVVRLTLNRPAKGNALGLTMAREVLAAIAAAEADESVHVLTLTGAGRIFCGGGDVQAMAAAPAGPEPVLVGCVVTPGFDFADFTLWTGPAPAP